MSATLVLLILIAYFGLLMFIAYLTRAKENNDFYLGGRQSSWYVVAYGMLGASLSGVTFISVPGWVESSQMTYMQMVLGYVVGYAVISGVLLPIYYRMQLTSIYSYLIDRFGRVSYKTGASFFLLSRVIGASFRLYLVAMVFHYAIFERLGWDVPFVASVVIAIALIWVYTHQGGIKTIIWTDTFQTTFMILAVIFTLVAISNHFDWTIGAMIERIAASENSRIFVFDDWSSSQHFVKNFLGGMFITIAMTGLDQDMMQKNLSCKNIGDAQKNMRWFSIVLVFINLLFLGLGVVLYIFAAEMGIEASGDELYPMIALDGYLGVGVGVLFILGLTAAAYSSADSALTSLTTSFTVDILEADKLGEKEAAKKRKLVHILFSVVLVLVILVFKAVNDESVISSLFKVASYTYGPLLGLYGVGIFTKWQLNDKYVWIVCLIAPVLAYVLNAYSVEWFNGYKFGFELLLLNGILCAIGLRLLKLKE